MKKILFILTLAVVVFGVSACTSDKGLSVTPAQVQDEAGEKENFVAPVSSLETELVLESDSTPVPNQESDKTNNLNNKTMTIKTPSEQAGLAKQYSQAILKTNYGEITVKLYVADAPVTVNNFLNLAASGFYDGVKFHRVIKDFMVQGGDPLSKEANTAVWGTGGPGYQFSDEINSHKLVAGSLAMANAGPGTNGSQFFIVTAPATPWLDGKHTNFGEVAVGMDIVKKIQAVETGVNDRPLKDVIINEVELLK